MITFLHNAGSCDMYTKLISLRHPCRHPRRRRRRRRRPCSRQGRGNISSHFLRSFVLRLNYSVALDARNLNRVRPGVSEATLGEARHSERNSIPTLITFRFPSHQRRFFLPCPRRNSLRKLLWCSILLRSRMSRQQWYSVMRASNKLYTIIIVTMWLWNTI